MASKNNESGELPAAFEMLDRLRAEQTRGRRLLVALDFDGTVAPIVPRVDDAQLLPGARDAIECLLKSDRASIALVSGRSLADLKKRAAFTGAYYAGNHGLELEGPGISSVHEAVLDLVPAVRAVAAELEPDLSQVDGIFFEDKHLSLSIHSRLVEDDKLRQEVHQKVEQAVARHLGTMTTYGKCVIEVRPSVAWHKGSATLYLIDAVEKAQNCEVFPVFLGDDLTDEDAFAAIRERGAGILVADTPRRTAARAGLRAPEDVIGFLQALAS